jgi:hypothetical protein
MIEDLLKKGIAMPVKKWHVGMSCIVPSCPHCAVDDPDQFHQKLMEDRWRAISGGYCRDDQIHVDAKAEKLAMDTMVPIWVMEVFALDLCASRTSILTSVLAIMSRICCSTMHAFSEEEMLMG